MEGVRCHSNILGCHNNIWGCYMDGLDVIVYVERQ